MRLSIIVNNYNYARFLSHAIDSALAVAHEDVEVIVVDDGSTDDSRSIIEKYDGKIRSILKPNGGQASAFNAGYAVATGEVVCFLDSDDVLTPEGFCDLLPKMRDPRVAQGHGRMTLIDETGTEIGPFSTAPLPEGDLKPLALRNGPWPWRVMATSANLWTRRYLNRVMPIPERTFAGEADVYLLASAPFYGHLAATEKVVALYRRHGQNSWFRPIKHIEDVQAHARQFELWASVMAEHAIIVGEDIDPNRWRKEDWRQQVRLLLLSNKNRALPRPTPRDLLMALWSDQSRIKTKIILTPVIAALAISPVPATKGLALNILRS